MTNTSNFNMRDYDFGVMFDGGLALNLGTSMCDRKSYEHLQQQGNSNYQLVTTSNKSAARSFLSSTNVAVFDFCAHPYNKDTDATRRLGFATKWSCVRSSANPTTVRKTTTTKRMTTKSTTTKPMIPRPIPVPAKPKPPVAPVNTGCGIPINSDDRPASKFQRIIGGVTPAPSAWPWAAALVFQNGQNEQQGCGASVLNSQWVVTAAHCVKLGVPEDVYLKGMKVYYGNQNLLKVPASQKASIVRAIVHPDYTKAAGGNVNDVALIKLTAPIPDFPNSMVSPICLPSDAIGTFKAQSYGAKGRPIAYVAGWGLLKHGHDRGDATIGGGTDQLLQTNIEIFSNNECHEALDLPTGRFPDTAICGGLDQGGRDACKGDSGGPLVMAEPPSYNRYSLFGISSFGYGCGEAGVPGAYSDVFKLKKWITDTMASN
ncbi:transmembrane protease serine 9-like [Paramacrobiotus metropolitanus]|uniref:transmembrane protease serine 9-like n=1 Tax=Paramacrobiotus metropolitanus TaxID=2943436 RepID=UPI00244618FF|nr:transmembrane protease serine 9-like [Paramacrobiotus metropolitanus]